MGSALTAAKALTVTDLGGQQVPRADHGPYVAAVAQFLDSRDVQVAGVAVTISDKGSREAILSIHPGEEDVPAVVPETHALGWDEERGWSLNVGDQTWGTSTFMEGTEVLPGPDAVAAWIAVVLTYPALAVHHDVIEFRQHVVSDPGFEARLARYAPGS